tara:strand:+ start:1600 stop:2346 length:747 start_codon:yes stop_codon:yes gene_type:complete
MINSEIKRVHSLEKIKYRQRYQQYFIEGKRLVQTAIEMQANLEIIYVTHSFLKDNSDFKDKIFACGVEMTCIPSKVMKKLSFTESPSGIAAICRLPKPNPLNESIPKWVFFDKISDPGNMGTLIRSAGYFGFNHIALSPDCVDPFNPKVVRAGMGAHFGLSIYTNVFLSQFTVSHTLIGADQSGKSSDQFSVPKNYVLVFGNEARGLSDESRNLLHEFVTINKQGFGESLNVSVAGSILMYKFSRKEP